MDQEITNAINGNTKTNVYRNTRTVHHSEHNAQPTRNGENEEENVIFFEKAGFGNVMVFVEFPHQTMHHIFVSKPSHQLHNEERSDEYENIEHHFIAMKSLFRQRTIAVQ